MEKIDAFFHAGDLSSVTVNWRDIKSEGRDITSYPLTLH